MLWPIRVHRSISSWSSSPLTAVAISVMLMDVARAGERPLPGRSGRIRRQVLRSAPIWLSQTVLSSANPWRSKVGLPAPMSRKKRGLSTAGPSFDHRRKVPREKQDGQRGSQLGDTIAVLGIEGALRGRGNAGFDHPGGIPGEGLGDVTLRVDDTGNAGIGTANDPVAGLDGAEAGIVPM